MGNIVGAGIYVLIGAASGLAGNAVWLSFVLAAIVALFTGLSYAELGSVYPKAASEYTFIGKAYGRRPLSFIIEWTMLMTEIVAASTVSLGFASYFHSITGLPIVLIAAAVLIALSAITLTGIKSSLRINTILSIVALAGLIVVISGGFVKFGSVDYTNSPNGMSGIVAASVLVFFAFIGFDNITNLSEETRNPQKLIPRGLLISLLLSMILYILVGLAVVSLVPWQQLSTSPAPLALAASMAFGQPAFLLLAVVALLTTFNTALVLLIVGSRIIYGMSRAGALPSAFGSLNKASAPYAASILVLLIALGFLSLGSIGIVAKVTSFGSLLVFAAINISLLHLRRTAPHLKRPFKAPLSVGWISITAVLGVVSCLALLSQFDIVSALLGLALPISGIIIYSFTDKKNLLKVDKNLHQTHE
ncbi:MAG: amino acid permease [Candidatus Micrarchaeota archaeon]|nr:amino acid permease [Candidatus Micrarchaeota archaeon]MDE1834205.1 amino acid permease [Candidatus Micrarchaeota archaeon]MDE1859924.1 amino acid permease [Candidatus Micrarchaeota archaeon]